MSLASAPAVAWLNLEVLNGLPPSIAYSSNGEPVLFPFLGGMEESGMTIGGIVSAKYGGLRRRKVLNNAQEILDIRTNQDAMLVTTKKWGSAVIPPLDGESATFLLAAKDPTSQVIAVIREQQYLHQRGITLYPANIGVVGSGEERIADRLRARLTRTFEGRLLIERGSYFVGSDRDPRGEGLSISGLAGVALVIDMVPKLTHDAGVELGRLVIDRSKDPIKGLFA